ncbi:hypothetical protein GO621_09435 [Mucilaginibacter sp. HMF7410]|uniref:Uncharacterized protein n=1 Tax=Mucilaginibacter arboris TaxID=2682090 RepID=A0A7K1SWY6_9SPHI|nr:hypothetical protein [Mucilaginibacter arboris]MVN21758.1 hypothetical protein [Mucilaginibacter arboris]
MKANHNRIKIARTVIVVGLNISNSKNESKSQHRRIINRNQNSWVKYQ